MNTIASGSKGTMHYLLLAFLFVTTSASAQRGHFHLAPLFTDNMVLQQQSNSAVWGIGTPGTLVSVQASWGASASTKVNADSVWQLKIRTPKAGGPFDITIGHDDTTLILRNVLCGEVWLCSGQSNMEMPLAGWPPNDTVMYSRDEIAHSLLPDLRVFTVGRAFSAEPEFSCAGEWVKSSPDASGGFSASAYFFGKKLYEQLHVPIGLIHSSWGGTRIESWISSDFLSKLPGYDSTLTRVRESAAGQRQLMNWLSSYPAINMMTRKGDTKWMGLKFQDDQCPSRLFDDASWPSMKLPTLWERTEVGNFDGVVWFRKQVKIPADWIHRNLVIELGPIDDIDVTYVNGVEVGSHEVQGQYNVDRKYAVPATIVDSTLMQIAVRVIDFGGGGGIYGNAGSMKLHPEQGGEPIMLAGEWKYLPVADYQNNMLFVFGPSGNQYSLRPRLPIDLSANTPTSLYNGMIAPLAPFTIRGSIWYQGESNVDNALQYRKLFPLLIANWRNDFKAGDFPFYYVQIAPYDYGTKSHSEFLREAQMATLEVKNTGMAVLLDVGNPANIHPANKQAVGERLASWALAKTYAKKVAFSGPIYKSSKKLKGAVEISFQYADKGLVLIGGLRGNGFQIAGEDRVFTHAYVEVHGSKLIVSNPDVPDPVAVRYAFTNTPGAALFNTDGLPASSFRTDDWEP